MLLMMQVGLSDARNKCEALEDAAGAVIDQLDSEVNECSQSRC